MSMYTDTAEEQAVSLIAESEAWRIIDEVRGYFSQEDGAFAVDVFSWSTVSQRWARNRATMASTQRDISVRILRTVRGNTYSVRTNQIDSDSLKSATEYAEYYATHFAPKEALTPMKLPEPQWDPAGAQVWSDATFNRTPTDNGETVSQITRTSREGGMLSAGYIETGAANIFKLSCDQHGRIGKATGQVTQAQCSITVRHPLGTGSGWAGNTSFDINRLSLQDISEVAFDKCIKSIDPVRLEPGRFQVILEPQASATFFMLLLGSMARMRAESNPRHPFFLGADKSLNRIRSKLGLQVVDKRLTIEHNPTDPVVGTHPDPGVGPATLIENGILKELFHGYLYAVNELVDQDHAKWRTSFKVPGTSTTVDTMISTMDRGLVVTTVSHPELLDSESGLHTGFTRNGLWLVENGRITKAVRNFRWTESPLFIFNNVEEIGVSVPVFSPANMRHSLRDSFASSLNNVAVPAVKVNDFSFTSTIDAI